MKHLVAGVIAASLGLPAAVSATTARQPDEAKRFLETKWMLVQSLPAVEQSVVLALRTHFSPDDRLADRGEPFDATDVVTGKPSRRFVLAGNAGTRWFVAYERGGAGHHLVLAVLNAAAKPPKVVMLARGHAGVHDDIKGWRVDLADLYAALKEKRLSVDDPEQSYY